jgi:hypothetical protein
MSIAHGDPHDDVGPSDALRAALSALPAERALPPSGLAHLNAEIARSRLSANSEIAFRAGVRRRIVAVVTVGIAALVTVVAGTQRMSVPQVAQRAVSSALLPEEQRDPRVRAVLDGTHAWRAAVRDSVRSARWPLEARTAVEEALVSTDRALADVRTVLRRDSTNVVALEALTTLRARQLTLLQNAMTLLDEL